MRVALVAFALTLLPAGSALAQARAAAPSLALVGATLIDVSDAGHSFHDLIDSTVVLEGNKIVLVGPRQSTPIPADAQIIDIAGCFLVPGLVDGFAGLNSQAQANATLYMGVTTIVGSGDDRRGILKLDAEPSPHVYPMDSAGSQDDYSLLCDMPEWSTVLKEGNETLELSPEQTREQLNQTAQRGTRAIWLGHNLTSDNSKRIIEQSRRLGLITYGEFVATPFADGLADGVDVLLHMSRYELGLVPEALQRPLIKDPEGHAQDAPYDFIFALSVSDPTIARYADQIRDSRAALMPTFSLEYLEMPGHRNLWQEPAASILDPKGLHLPPDRTTGEAKFRSDSARLRSLTETAKLWDINRAMLLRHPAYLAASGSSAVGTMPGISMHTELELMVRLGLAPREALAAATSNYAARFGWSELGQIEVGRRADILVLSANPVLDINNSRQIRSVILDGRELDRAELLRLPK